MAISIEAKDFYGLPLYVGDSVIPVLVGNPGKIDGIYNVDGHTRVSIFDEKAKIPVFDLDPLWLTTQERFDEHHKD